MSGSEKVLSKAWWEAKYSRREKTSSQDPSPHLKMMADRFCPEGLVVDLGCGEGRHAIWLASKNFKVEAIDFSSTALERAKSAAQEANVTLDFKSQDLDFFLPKILSYDAIVAVDLYLAPTLQKNLVRGLKQNGHLYLEGPLVAACKNNTLLEVGECYKPNELLRAFGSQSGLKILYYSEMDSERVVLLAQKAELF